MPPKHDLRGGNQSDDSFAISRTIFVASMSRCFFTVESHEILNETTASIRTRAWPSPRLTSRRASFSKEVGHVCRDFVEIL